MKTIIACAVSILCAVLFYRLRERAIRKGEYTCSRWGRNKETIWDLLFYISFVASAFFIAAVLGFMD